MNLKQRFSLFFSFLFSLLLATAMLIIYYLFAKFREEEFRDRLSEKAETTVKLLLEVKEVDYQLQKIIDRDSINRLYNEKTLIFNHKMDLIYSSLDDAVVPLTREELEQVKGNKVIFKRSREYDVLGMHYSSNKQDYYVFIAAEDEYGNNKLRYLKYLLLIAFIVGTILVWLLSFYLSKKSLAPLIRVSNEIREITDKNLNKRLHESEKNDELKVLSSSFNQMMDRIDNAYQRQKEFTGNASHELRTPIAKILAQLENIQQTPNLPTNVKSVLDSVTDDTSQLSEIVTSLLILSEVNNRQAKVFQKIRLDEIHSSWTVIFSKLNKDFRLQFEIESNGNDINLEIYADEVLLQIAFINLIRNAYLYSDNKSLQCVLSQQGGYMCITFRNSGPTPNIDDTSELFITFSRGSNTHKKPGSGVGLSIVKRILQHHHASIHYNIPAPNLNEIVIRIPYSV